ncbi:MBL fold metallo-hydrolase [Leptospira mtsangambouensis]|uniref:MBL fold metallo-hydrolase n=1 Tax=Leptospira mtsangambouensis TaxID=2484912 RepID=UPI001EECCFD7|nr:MBL fold metallo-hydrolase [Leptospira mtsangambouensis]MCG6141336.1 MBL fold metallo-hydrolase [Leptospira mtsangambouensis]
MFQHLGSVFSVLISLLTLFCQVTSHQVKPYTSDKITERVPLSPQPKHWVELKVVKVADWEASLAGLLDLDDPKAKMAGLKDRLEPISIYFYVIKHPIYGTYLIDSGIGESFSKGEAGAYVSSIVESQMNLKRLKVYETTNVYLSKNKIALKGIFYTHLHLDHVLGAYELDRSVPFYVGPGEVTTRQFINLFVQGSTNRLLGENPNLVQLDLEKNQIKVLDFFGDQSFFVIAVPGHTPGSLAFFVPTKDGSHLILGDSCHTEWGWKESVVPGAFTTDQKLNRKSLEFLKKLAETNKPKFVYPGHQERILNQK